ncbi:MAG TPA: MarR family winged helix-turn-helix transcriptional regulator, partial [Trebonia sp.]|nr:MarR family winged helix-turn-helix transcriptional regulator [Trebonia sp.]
ATAQDRTAAADCPAGPECPGDQAGPDGDGFAERVDSAIQRLAHAGRLGAWQPRATPSGLTALEVLAAGGPLRVGELAARTGVAFPAMSRIVDRIVQDGLARRHPDESDHRACVITITGAGQALIDAARRDRSASLAAGLDHLAPEDRTALLAALPVLESLADRVAGESPRPARSA